MDEELTETGGGAWAQVLGETKESDGARRTGERTGCSGGQSTTGKAVSSCAGWKRNYFWCPVVDCTSSPVQKVTQHLQNVDKMDSPTAAKLARKKWRAPDEAVRLKIPNPSTRSSGLQSLELVLNRVEMSRPLSVINPLLPTRPATRNYLASSTQVAHSWLALTVTCGPMPGGERGNHATKQIVTYMGKYLHYLNDTKVEEEQLLLTATVVPYREALTAAGVGSRPSPPPPGPQGGCGFHAT